MPTAGADGEEGLNNVPLPMLPIYEKINDRDSAKQLTQEKLQERKLGLELSSAILAPLLLYPSYHSVEDKMLRISVAGSQILQESSYLNSNLRNNVSEIKLKRRTHDDSSTTLGTMDRLVN